MKKILIRCIPFMVFAILAVFLWRGLYLNPHEIPSSYVGKKIPDFSLPIISKSGNDFLKNPDLNGEVSLLNVWASWCMACKDEQAFLLKLADSGIKIYGLNYKDDKDNALNWLKNWGNPYAVVFADKDGKVALDLGVYGSPETFLVDKNGVILYRHAGILTEKIWKEEFLPILNNLQRG